MAAETRRFDQRHEVTAEQGASRMNGKELSALIAAIHDSEPVSGLSHTLYKYPARFSPVFAKEVIRSFTEIGDLVLDPFVGGGTALVEAIASGRDAVGVDVNELAIFVARVKTTVFTARQLRGAGSVIDGLCRLKLSGPAKSRSGSEYALNIDDTRTWRIRDFVGLCLSEIGDLSSGPEEGLVRCVLLRTAQWALDCRKAMPTLEEFRERLQVNWQDAVLGATEMRENMIRARAGHRRPRCLCLLRSAVGVERDERIRGFGRPSLIITSPPYPGVHVLYHRWQINGRRESAAPYWIANLQDGRGASYYTFADRNRKEIDNYLSVALEAFSSVRRLVERGTPLVQLVAFSDPKTQLGPYLEMLSSAGWEEMRFDVDRIWRSVPGRRWYTSFVASAASREAVLFHRAR